MKIPRMDWNCIRHFQNLRMFRGLTAYENVLVGARFGARFGASDKDNVPRLTIYAEWYADD